MTRLQPCAPLIPRFTPLKKVEINDNVYQTGRRPLGIEKIRRLNWYRPEGGKLVANPTSRWPRVHIRKKGVAFIYSQQTQNKS